MKFTIEEEEQHYEIKSSKKMVNVTNYCIYDNLSVFTIRPDFNTSFKDLAECINNGQVSASWSIRINNIDDRWVIFFAPHPKVSVDLNIKEIVEGLVENVEGHLRLAIIKPKTKSDAEDVVNILIKEFSNKRIPGIELLPIDKDYSLVSSTGVYKLVNVKNVESFDDETYYKYLRIIETITEKEIEDLEVQDLDKISKRMVKNKILSKSDISYLNKMSEKYVTQNEKVRIALQYLSNISSED